MSSPTRATIAACRAIKSATLHRNPSLHHNQVIQFIHRRNSSTQQHCRIFSTQSTTPETKKSPHSKLLRVCSSRNPNKHYASIEAEILQLNWKTSMAALVNDWMANGNKWGDFTELESNVCSYVDDNLPFLLLDWRKGRFGNEYKEMQARDCIRLSYFPYEEIISGVARHAISGTVRCESYSSGNKVDEIEARQLILFEANKMLASMCDFNTNDPNVWTEHHTSCSKCFRLVLSGWFLMWRRLRDVDNESIGEGNTTAAVQMYNCAKRWISFCTNGKVVEDQHEVKLGEALVGGIEDSDKSLLLGVAMGLSLSKHAEQQAQADELRGVINRLFEK